MTRLPFDDYLRHLRSESTRFREVLADCDPAARVPACPDWDADDLLWHLATVQHFWARIVTDRPAAPSGEEPERPAGREALLGWFDQASTDLADALAQADPAEAAWTWSIEQTVGFTYRRQALEALVHRLDAEQAAGEVTALDPRLAADGVAEVVGVMFGGHPEWGHFEPRTEHLRLDLTDAGVSVWARLGTFSGTDPDTGKTYADETDIALVDDPGSEADAVVSGTAGDVLAWLWQRADDGVITVDGDRSVYAAFRGVLTQPLN